MKNILLAVTFIAALAVSTGCKPKVTDSTQTTSEKIAAVKADTKEAAQELKDYTYAQRKEFTSSMELRLAQLNKDLDALTASVDKSSDAVKLEAKPKIAALRVQLDGLKKQLDIAQNATESTWDDVKAGVKKGFEDVKSGFNNARTWLSEKIAP